MTDRFSDIYFSGSQAQLVVNDTILTEATGVEGVLQVSRAPIYGYASKHFDGVGTGRILAMGSFSVNYVFDGYLFAHIQNLFRDKEDSDVKASDGTIIKPHSNASIKPDQADNYFKDIDAHQEITNELFSSSDEAVQWYKSQYWDTGDNIGFEEDKMRPEFLGPFRLKIRDYKIGDRKDISNYEEKIFVDVYLDKYSTVRKTAAGPTQEVYTFISKTFI